MLMNVAKAVIDEGESIKVLQSCMVFIIQNYVGTSRVVPAQGYKRTRQLFSNDQEKDIAVYLHTTSHFYYSMPPKESGVLAYQYGIKFNAKNPESRDKFQSVGRIGYLVSSRYYPTTRLWRRIVTKNKHVTPEKKGKKNSVEISSEENVRNDFQGSDNRSGGTGLDVELLYIFHSCKFWLHADCSGAKIHACYISLDCL
ncbi:hypothetical protein RF11_05254 [Thelohanellus kitauei]|uniref:Uncharacterized protein n=1 Tax=Thelohanellus kitauei TaxID=669202 RepID=A0A0C2J0K4_THEKT|nr:hypothetical protein RF11_05254 [Thelohanellus kitauei]